MNITKCDMCGKKVDKCKPGLLKVSMEVVLVSSDDIPIGDVSFDICVPCYRTKFLKLLTEERYNKQRLEQD